jgi:ABC-type nitrate/sulfonate/bicarbonate transport system substrate-binding protein
MQTIRLALEWIPNTVHTGFYEAIDRGYYAQAGLNVEIFMPDDHGDGRQWLLNGKANFAITEQMSMSDFFVKDQQTPLVALAALMDHNRSGLLTNSDIKSPKDLTHRTYATFGYPTEQHIIGDTINADGGDFSQTKMVSNDMIFDPVTDLQQRKYDGIFVYHHWEGLMAKLANNNEHYNFFYVKDFVPAFDYYTPVIAANQNFVDDNQTIVRQFLQATARGYAAAKNDPEDAAKVLMRYVPDRMLQRELVVASQVEVSQHYRLADDQSFAPIDEQNWRLFYDWLNQQGLGQQIDPSIGFDNQYLN